MSEKLSNMTEVVETSSSCEVNEYLRNGWKLIDTYKTTAFSTENTDQTVMYVLGRPED